jgi:hypothetical protein
MSLPYGFVKAKLVSDAIMKGTHRQHEMQCPQLRAPRLAQLIAAII